MQILAPSGRRSREFDPSNDEQVAAVRAEFDQLVTRDKFLAYVVTHDGSEVVREFDPTAERTVLSPQLQGG